MSTTETLSVAFPYDLDDVVDASYRHALHTRTVQSSRRTALVGSGIAGLVFCALPIWLFDPERTVANPWPALLLAVPAAGAAILYEHQTRDSRSRQRIRRLLAESWDASAHHVCEIELTQGRVVVRQPNLELAFHWQDFVAGRSDPDGVELRFRAGYVFARARAFSTPEDQARFLERARTLASART